MEKSQNFKKICSFIISCCGIALVIAGIAVLATSANHCGPSGCGVSRASTEIEFGADFYTTMAQYSGLTANTATDIYSLLNIGYGITFIFSGLITFFSNLPNALSLFNSNFENNPIAETINEKQTFEEENI